MRDDRSTPVWRAIANAIRHVAVRVTSSRLWQVGGVSGEFDPDVPVFSGVGFYSRPPEGSDAAEAIVLKIQGNADLPVIVATHDEDLRRVHTEVRDLSADEVAIFNSGGLIKITVDGDIVIRPKSGREVLVDDGSGGTSRLVTETTFLNHTHATAGTGTPSEPIPLPPALAFVFTELFKAK